MSKLRNAIRFLEIKNENFVIVHRATQIRVFDFIGKYVVIKGIPSPEHKLKQICESRGLNPAYFDWKCN